jgi:hypothetical protein
MTSHTLPYNDRHELPHRRSLGQSILWILWQTVRLPVLAVLLVLEPFVTLMLTAFGFLGIVTALILEFSGDVPHFPFWTMTAFSVGAIMLLMAYHALLTVFSR